MSASGGPEGDALLALWERGLDAPSWARGDALVRDGHDLPARALGVRNAKLMALHAQLFGRELPLLSHCPACRTAVEFTADCTALAGHASAADSDATHLFEVNEHCIEFRLARSADLAAAPAEPSDEFARHVLERCVLSCTSKGESVDVRELPLAILDALSRRMEALDPSAALSFDVTCPQCAMRWDARLDIAAAVWQKVHAAAERVLLDVDALARAYGWTESEVLRLTPARRSAYLQLIAA